MQYFIYYRHKLYREGVDIHISNILKEDATFISAFYLFKRNFMLKLYNMIKKNYFYIILMQ